MTLRRLRLEDVDRIVELEQALFGTAAWTPGMVTEELTAPGRHYVGIDHDGVLVGYAGAFLAEESHVMTIGVEESMRRRGFATAMLRDLMAAAASHGATSMILEVRADDDGPQALYRRHGFEPIGRRRRYYPGGADAVVMRARLTGS